jgi:hypothetical protein
MNKRIILAVFLSLCGSGQTTARDLILVCKGYGYPPRGAAWHSIVIHEKAAEVDGKPYLLSESPTEFTLKGPTPTNNAIIWIDRINGQYSISALDGLPLEDSGGYRGPSWHDTGTDEGCRQKSQEF